MIEVSGKIIEEDGADWLRVTIGKQGISLRLPADDKNIIAAHDVLMRNLSEDFKVLASEALGRSVCFHSDPGIRAMLAVRDTPRPDGSPKDGDT
jgi:hypothetical protein